MRLRNKANGVVVNVDDAKAERLGSGWEPVDAKAKPAPATAPAKKVPAKAPAKALAKKAAPKGGNGTGNDQPS